MTSDTASVKTLMHYLKSDIWLKNLYMIEPKTRKTNMVLKHKLNLSSLNVHTLNKHCHREDE